MADHDFDMTKPWKGTLENWFEYRHPGAIGLGLNYTLTGDLHYRKFAVVPNMTTAYVLKRDGSDVETSNARYSLGAPKEK